MKNKDLMINEYNDLTRKLFLKLHESSPKDNIVFSPFSILMLLGMIAHATDGNTREEVIHVLSKKISVEKLRSLLGDYQRLFTENGGIISSNAVCVNDKHKDNILPEYSKQLQNLFEGELFISKNLSDDVNKWVNKKTDGMIPQIADPSLNATIACLINAILFESEWKEPYKEDDIYEDEDIRFENIDGTSKSVCFLDSEEKAYIENDKLTGFMKPYKNYYSFMALLPKEEGVSGINSCIQDLDISSLFASASYEKVSATIPEYKYSFGQDMTDVCQRLGIKEAFTDFADFSNMATEPLKIDSIIHKARIEVDRKGTKAAAASAAFTFAGCAPMQIKSVDLNRPFIYAIVHNETRLPVFIGVLNNANTTI